MFCIPSFRNENAPTFDGVTAFSSILHLFQFFNCTSSDNYFCKKLLTLHLSVYSFIPRPFCFVYFLPRKLYYARETLCCLHQQCNFVKSLEAPGFLKIFCFRLSLLINLFISDLINIH